MPGPRQPGSLPAARSSTSTAIRGGARSANPLCSRGVVLVSLRSKLGRRHLQVWMPPDPARLQYADVWSRPSSVHAAQPARRPPRPAWGVLPAVHHRRCATGLCGRGHGHAVAPHGHRAGGDRRLHCGLVSALGIQVGLRTDDRCHQVVPMAPPAGVDPDDAGHDDHHHPDAAGGTAAAGPGLVHRHPAAAQHLCGHAGRGYRRAGGQQSG